MDCRFGSSDSNDIISNGSSSCCVELQPSSTSHQPEFAALHRLSRNLDSTFDPSSEFNFFADAKIVVPGGGGGREVPVHRCILSSRSEFFRNVFCSAKENCDGRFELKELAKDYEVGFEPLVAVLGYLYSGTVRALPSGICECVDDDCSHLGCRPAVDFMVEVLYASFTFQVPELVALYQVKTQALFVALKFGSPFDILALLHLIRRGGY
ncbi:unnamed protein product [Linum tenue]|uniref:BTB domain-containing protein n=1 Tax=Linum tenue TaxID=586396 RepID=A0AAV0HR83_9ROSI|nr:unnamed protein product [Linum tenue]